MSEKSESKGRRGRGSDSYARTVAGLGHLVDAVTPWLLDLGGWIFGALIAFNLVMLGALLTVGPVDLAVKISTASIAIALPTAVAGFLILRLAEDITKGKLTEVATKAFQEAGFTLEGGSSSAGTEQRGARAALRYSYLLLFVTATFTLVEISAALWHMAWWIAAVFIVMLVISQGPVGRTLAGLTPGGRWRTAAGEVEPESKV